MSPTPKKADLLQVQRYVDGELSPDSRTVFEARLQEEPALLQAVEAAREQSQLFRDDPAADLGPPRASVMNAVMTRCNAYHVGNSSCRWWTATSWPTRRLRWAAGG